MLPAGTRMLIASWQEILKMGKPENDLFDQNCCTRLYELLMKQCFLDYQLGVGVLSWNRTCSHCDQGDILKLKTRRCS